MRPMRLMRWHRSMQTWMRHRNTPVKYRQGSINRQFLLEQQAHCGYGGCFLDKKSLFHVERYQEKVMALGHQLINRCTTRCYSQEPDEAARMELKRQANSVRSHRC